MSTSAVSVSMTAKGVRTQVEALERLVGTLRTQHAPLPPLKTLATVSLVVGAAPTSGDGSASWRWKEAQRYRTLELPHAPVLEELLEALAERRGAGNGAVREKPHRRRVRR